MKKLVLFPALLLYLTVSLFSLMEFHGDSPNGKPRECLLCKFTNTPINAAPALAVAPEYVLPEQRLQLIHRIVFHEIIGSSHSLFILPSDRAPPVT
jgi:hypothetical protein